MSDAWASDEHGSREEARFVPWGGLADCVPHQNRCSTTWASQRHHYCVWDREWMSHREGLQLMQFVCVHLIFTINQMLFIPQVPLHDFPVRVSGFRLDSQSSMYQGNMQITMLLAESIFWQTELERTVKSTTEEDILYRNIWFAQFVDTYSQNCLMKMWSRATTDASSGDSAPFRCLSLKA